jgi:hypothetical protein
MRTIKTQASCFMDTPILATSSSCPLLEKILMKNRLLSTVSIQLCSSTESISTRQKSNLSGNWRVYVASLSGVRRQKLTVSERRRNYVRLRFMPAVSLRPALRKSRTRWSKGRGKLGTQSSFQNGIKGKFCAKLFLF